MTINPIDVGKVFYHRLANRDETQGDGQHTALEFREKFLEALDNLDIWARAPRVMVILDFRHVAKIGPSFANEAFAYFTKFPGATPAAIKARIEMRNLSQVKRRTIDVELESGYRPR